MSKLPWTWTSIALLVGLGLSLMLLGSGVQAEEPGPSRLITGRVYDPQGEPVKGVQVVAFEPSRGDSIAQSATQADGRYALAVPDSIPDSLVLQLERTHFEGEQIDLDPGSIQILISGQAVVLPDTVLPRHIGPAFWLATIVFLGVLVTVALGRLHNTLAALAGATLILGISYLSHLILESLFVFDFQSALGYVDWNVVFLIMGMMMVIAVIERTGIFQWLAFMAYRVSGGRVWLLTPILMVVTGIGSAFLDNVTTMLLITPITIQIAMALGINPLALLMPEVMASNVAGVSTLVGTPTNILIGSYGGITFNDFITNLTPGVLLALVGLIVYSEFAYRRELSEASAASPVLLARLAERARITEPAHLKKAGWVGAGMLVLFLFGERIHLLPAVTALIGATALLLWIRPDIEEMIEAVDWTTLVFFIALFIVVGAIQEVGLISLIADLIGRLVGDSLMLAMLAIVWLGALLSTVVANIPFTAAMLPVVGYLTAIVPGAQNRALFYSLSVGSGMGGNGSLIGASANMVTAGIAERAGYPMTYAYFLKRGLPALVITVGLATGWLLLRFLVLGGSGG
jgi:Na+/H+ antiporter NhaD/arsenite permease-like protein